MPAEHERRALHEIEDDLLTTDPVPAGARSGAGRGRWKTIVILADVTAVLRCAAECLSQREVVDDRGGDLIGCGRAASTALRITPAEPAVAAGRPVGTPR